MRGVERIRHVDHDLDHVLDPKDVSDLLQRGSGDVLHRDVGMSRRFAHLVHLTDVLVADPRLDLRLAREPLHHLRVVAMQELQRDRTTEAGIRRLVDVAHPALADELDEDIAIPFANREAGVPVDLVEGHAQRGRWRGTWLEARVRRVLFAVEVVSVRRRSGRAVLIFHRAPPR